MAVVGSITKSPTPMTNNRDKSEISTIAEAKTCKVMSETPVVREYRVSCVDRACTINKGCESSRETKLAEIFAPRRLKKNRTFRVIKMESMVRPTNRTTAPMPITTI